MKNVLKIFALSSLILVLASCGTANDIYGNNPNNRYPNSNGTVYRANDGQVYRRGDVYRDRNGNVYQNGRIIRTGNVYGNKRNLPPGQAKKIYGGSAKDYAKGQQKKRSNQWKKYNDDHNDYKKGKGNNKKYKKH